MELSAASAPVGNTQGHHATGNGVLWRILAAGLLTLSLGAENSMWPPCGPCGKSKKMLGRVA